MMKRTYDGDTTELELGHDIFIPAGTRFYASPTSIIVDAGEYLEATVCLNDDETMTILIPKSYFNK